MSFITLNLKKTMIGLMVFFVCALASFAHAENKYPFVNAKYIDETTSWQEIHVTIGYVVKSPVTYIVEGRKVNGMHTCRIGEELYTWLTSPVWGPGSEAGVSGSDWQLVKVPTTYKQSLCVFEGSDSQCQPVDYDLEQKIKFSFDVPVKAIQVKDGLGTQFEWGTAFTKKFEVPNCQ